MSPGILKVYLITEVYYMASTMSGQDELNPALWLATQAGKMAQSCLLGITLCVLQENSILFSHNKSLINQACLVKVAGYCSCSSLCVYEPHDFVYNMHISN